MWSHQGGWKGSGWGRGAAAGGGGGSTSLAGTAQTTWNPADKGTAAVLANSNRDFVGPPSGSFASVRAVNSASSSQKYIEYKFTAVAGTTACVGLGLATASADLSTYLGNSASGAMVWFNANSDFANGLTKVNAITPGNAVLNDIWAMAVDLTAGKVWMAQNNAWLNSGNPASGANPWLTFTPGAAWFPAATESNGTPSGTITIAATTAYDAPSGFTVF